MSWKNVQYQNGKLRTSEGGGGGASALSDLTDVDLTNLADGDTLVYDEQNQKWVNGAGGGGGGSSITALNTDQITSLNTPYNLSDAISDYDLILIQMYYTGGSGYPYCGQGIISPLLLSSHNNSTWIDGGNNDRALHVQFPTTTTIQIIQSNGGNGIHGVYGIKLVSSGGGGSSTFEGLDDVSFSDIQNGQVPKYNSTTQKWENANESGGGASTLASLTDVDLSNLEDGQIIKWDATNSKWVNTNESGGGGSSHTYSTTEQVIGTWIDGKPLYQKSYELPNTVNISNSTNLTTYMADITSTLERFIFAFGCGTAGKSTSTFYIQFYNSQITAWATPAFDTNIITVQYTKTSDA